MRIFIHASFLCPNLSSRHRINPSLIFLVIIFCGYTKTLAAFDQAEQRPFKFTITADSTSLKPEEGTTYNIDIDWDNDGIYDEIGVTGEAKHTYDVVGPHTISIRGEINHIPDFIYYSPIHRIEQWGDIEWSRINCGSWYKLTYLGSDVPKLRDGSSLRGAFQNCYDLDDDISDWDVSNVTDMSYMFDNARSFNQPLDNWDVSNVTDMSNMFDNAWSFNQPLNNWDVSNVTDMSNMFNYTLAFNQRIHDWDVSSVINMSRMFSFSRFNQPLDEWDVSNVTGMSGMFWNNRFYDWPLNDWDVSSVADMSSMFERSVFNQPLDEWDVSNVIEMNSMFQLGVFNHDINVWDVSSVTNMGDMFRSSAFSQPIDSWDVSNVTNMRFMFTSSRYNRPLGMWDLSGLKPNGGLTLGGFMSIDNWDETIIGWAAQNVNYNDIIIEAENLQYCRAINFIDVLSYRGLNFDGHRIAGSATCEKEPCLDLSMVSKSDLEVQVTPLTCNNPGEINFPSIRCPDGSTMRFSIDEQTTWSTRIPIYDGHKPLTIHTSCFCNTDPDSMSVAGIVTTKPPLCGAISQRAFNFTTTKDTLTIRPKEGTSYDINIDWNNDGIYDVTGVTGELSYSYETAGPHTISINGELDVIPYISVYKDITRIEQWGDIEWSSVSLKNWSSLVYAGSDVPNLQNVTSLSGAFQGCIVFNDDINNWDVSNVTDMSFMFSGARQRRSDGGSKFNQPIDNWDVSNVTDMSSMFEDASSFNKPLGNWDVTNVINMSNMFKGAGSFNQPLSSWDVSNVTDMSGMLSGYHGGGSMGDFITGRFNQPINDWDVSSVQNMVSMFRYNISFNQDISDWDVSNVTTMDGMFFQTSGFNQPLNNWDVSNVVSMSNMFANFYFGNSRFNQPLDNWDVSSVTNMRGMFNYSFVFDQPLGSWDLSGLAPDGGLMISFAMSLENWDKTLIGWASQDLTYQEVTISARGVNYCEARDEIPILADRGLEIDGHSLAESCDNTKPYVFTVVGSEIDIVLQRSDPNTLYEIDWDNDGTYDDVNLTGGISHTYGADGEHTIAIRGTLETPPTLRSRDKLLRIEQWGDIEWTNMNEAYKNCTNLVYLGADTPNLSKVKNMRQMFKYAGVNDDINDWDVSNITNMSEMFCNATSFNQPLNNWDVSNVTEMHKIFYAARSFNQPLNDWDLSSISGGSGPISFDNSVISVENWDKTIIGWATQDVNYDNLLIIADGLEYCEAVSFIPALNNKGLRFSGHQLADSNCETTTTCPELDDVTELDLVVQVVPNTCDKPGEINLPIGRCPPGSTLQFSLNDGETWLTDIPIYNASESITIRTSCICNIDPTKNSVSGFVTTKPVLCDENNNPIESSSCRFQDSLALIDLYKSLSPMWDLSEPINTWEGISLSEEGCVIAIDLSGLGLSGTLPENLGTMEHLMHLDLSDNIISGPVPPSYADYIKRLLLNNNELSGRLPIDLMVFCDLSDCSFIDQNGDLQNCEVDLTNNNLPCGGDISVFCNQSDFCDEPAETCGVLYGMFEDDGVSFAKINQATGVHALITDKISYTAEHSTIDPTKELYTYVGQVEQGRSERRLYTLDIKTGNIISQPELDLTFGSIEELQYHPCTGVLYGLYTELSGGSRFSIIDPITGQHGPISGRISEDGRSSTINLAADVYYYIGKEYKGNEDYLYTVELSSGEVLRKQRLDERYPGMQEIQYSTCNDLIYMLFEESEGVRLSSMDPVTANATRITGVINKEAFSSTFDLENLDYIYVGEGKISRELVTRSIGGRFVYSADLSNDYVGISELQYFNCTELSCSDCSTTEEEEEEETASCPDLGAITGPSIAVGVTRKTCDQRGDIHPPSRGCPRGSTMTYALNGGAYNITSLPSYDQSGSMIIRSRCICDSNTGYFSATATVTTDPEVCFGSSTTEIRSRDQVLIGKTEGLKIYPNPVRDELTLDIYVTEETLLRVEILDIIGNKVESMSSTIRSLEKGTESIKLNVGDLTTGIYLISVQMNQSTQVKKVIVID